MIRLTHATLGKLRVRRSTLVILVVFAAAVTLFLLYRPKPAPARGYYVPATVVPAGTTSGSSSGRTGSGSGGSASAGTAGRSAAAAS